MPLARLSQRPPRAGEYTTPGAYNRYVTLATSGNPSAGIAASAAFTSWAAKRALTAEEIDKAQQIAQKVSYVYTIPYQLGVAESMQLWEWEGGTQHVYQIAGIEDPDGRHVELRMMCFEIGQNAGSSS